MSTSPGHRGGTWPHDMEMLVAGGYVTALELQRPTAKIMQQNTCLAKPFLAHQEKLKDICQLKIGNALKFEELAIYKNNFYDIIWAGNFIHYLTPLKAK